MSSLSGVKVDILFVSLSYSHCVLFAHLFQLFIYNRHIEDGGNVTRSLDLFDATIPQKVNTINQMILGWDDQVRHIECVQ